MYGLEGNLLRGTRGGGVTPFLKNRKEETVEEKTDIESTSRFLSTVTAIDGGKMEEERGVIKYGDRRWDDGKKSEKRKGRLII